MNNRIIVRIENPVANKFNYGVTTNQPKNFLWYPESISGFIYYCLLELLDVLEVAELLLLVEVLLLTVLF